MTIIGRVKDWIGRIKYTISEEQVEEERKKHQKEVDENGR